jgi:hypothetical protein
VSHVTSIAFETFMTVNFSTQKEHLFLSYAKMLMRIPRLGTGNSSSKMNNIVMAGRTATTKQDIALRFCKSIDDYVPCLRGQNYYNIEHNTYLGFRLIRFCSAENNAKLMMFGHHGA